MKINNLHDLLVHELKDLYHAEKQLVRALPKAAKAAANRQLKDALTDHHAQTKVHVERLERALEMLEATLRAEKCEAMEGLIAEVDGVLEEMEMGDVRDAAIIAGAQRIEHYEIAGYGTARAFAARLGQDDVAELLGETLEEEGEADKLLTSIAEGAVNDSAIS